MEKCITIDLRNPKIQYLCERDKRLKKLISMVGPIQYTIRDSDDSYRFLIHEIIEQMLSVIAGNAIFNRLNSLCNEEITPEVVAGLSDAQIRSIGTSNTKVSFIRSITNSVLSGELNFPDLENMSDDEVLRTLISIRGIGTWTAKMYLLFVLNRENILPFEDVAFLQAYQWLYKTSDRSSNAVIKKCKKWSQYSSYAARYLYRALDTGLTKEEFHLFK